MRTTTTPLTMHTVVLMMKKPVQRLRRKDSLHLKKVRTPRVMTMMTMNLAMTMTTMKNLIRRRKKVMMMKEQIKGVKNQMKKRVKKSKLLR